MPTQTTLTRSCTPFTWRLRGGSATPLAASSTYGHLLMSHSGSSPQIVGYRRHGHNELDDPSLTLPHTTACIAAHPRVKTLYAEKCVASDVVSEGAVHHWEVCRHTEFFLCDIAHSVSTRASCSRPLRPASRAPTARASTNGWPPAGREGPSRPPAQPPRPRPNCRPRLPATPCCDWTPC